MTRGRQSGLTPTERDLLRAGLLSSERTGQGRFWAFEVQKVFEEMTGRSPSWGTIFPALRRLELMGHVTSEWAEESDTGRPRRRYYSLTGSGEREAAVTRASVPTPSARRARSPGLS